MPKCEYDKKLEDLVMKFHIDKYHPKYTNYVKTKRILPEFIREYRMSQDDFLFVYHTKTDLEYFIREAQLPKMSYTAYSYDEIESNSIQWTIDQHIIIVSYFRWAEIYRKISYLGGTPISLYNYFEQKNIINCGNYYDVFGLEYTVYKDNSYTFNFSEYDINRIFFDDKKVYDLAKDKSTKEIFLAKMIFDAVWARDFQLIDKLIKEYVSYRYNQFELYLEFLDCIKKLLAELKIELQHRTQKDIIMFWLDALEYGEDEDIPFLKKLNNKCINFQNSFTVTPYTHFTVKSLFYGERTVFDRSYRHGVNSDSKLCEMLSKKQYKMLFYTGLNQVNAELKASHKIVEWTPLTAIFWYFLNDLIMSEQPVFAILHECFQTHPPYVSMDITDNIYECCAPYKSKATNLTYVYKKQFSVAKKYIDRVLNWCSQYTDDMCSIYMSDHGYTTLGKYHTILKIVDKSLGPKDVLGNFSYCKFPQLIEKITDGDQNYEDLCDQYAYIEDVDYYYDGFICDLLRKPNLVGIELQQRFGYVGVITSDVCYKKYSNGVEEYYSTMPNQPITEEMVNKARKLCSDYPLEIISEDKFTYSRCIRKTWENHIARCQDIINHKKHVICSLIEKLDENDGIALRGGGIHTYYLWQLLPWHLRKKISIVIDQDNKCMASRLGIKIIQQSEIEQYPIHTIILSSFDHEHEWKADLEAKYGKKYILISIYEHFKINGIYCQEEFYKEHVTQQDIYLP